MFSDSRYLYCYCSTNLFWIKQTSPYDNSVLKDNDLELDLKEDPVPGDTVSVIATQPLTESPAWTRMQPGELLIFKSGEVVKRYAP